MLAPERIAALSPLARDPSLSFYATEATHYPVVRPDAEAVLRLHPDLVLAGVYGASGALSLLKDRVRIVTVEDPQTFPAIAETIENLGRTLDEPARANAIVARMTATLSAIPDNAHGTALLLEPRGWTAGPGTLASAVLDRAGWHNIGTGAQLDLETARAQRPRLLLTETTPKTPSLATDWLSHPALATLPRRTIDGRALLCGLPQTAELAASLAQ